MHLGNSNQQNKFRFYEYSSFLYILDIQGNSIPEPPFGYKNNQVVIGNNIR